MSSVTTDMNRRNRNKPPRPPGSRPPRPAPNRFDRRRRAEEIAQSSGIPLEKAAQVAAGKLSLPEVLKRMRLEEEVQRLHEEGKLRDCHLQQVLSGTMDVPKALFLARLDHKKHEPEYLRSSLPELLAQETEVTLASLGGRLLTGRLLNEEAYEVTLKTREGETVTLPKHDIKFFLKAEERKLVLKHLERKDDIALLAPETLRSRARRNDYRARSLLLKMESGEPLNWITVEGDVLRGTVLDFGRYEVRVKTSRGAELYLLRHALLSAS